MRKLLLLCLLGWGCVQSSWAVPSLEPLLNKLRLELHTEHWITTKTALVNISVFATVTDQGIERIQAEIMQKLNQFANKAEWHIVSFNRQQDKSGLESIQIIAQARLAQTDLSSLRTKAKALSKPGETYSIADVQFIPSEGEINDAQTQMRNEIYRQAKAEIENLNHIYPEEKFYIHSVNFIPGMMPQPMENNDMSGKVYAMAARAPSPPLTVGNQQKLHAEVVLASTPAILNQKVSNSNAN